MTNSIPKKHVVGITQRVDYISDRSEFRDALDQRLVNWVMKAGFLPVAIPNTLLKDDNLNYENLKEWLLVVAPYGLLLSGGNNIGQYPSRDATEAYLLSWAKLNLVPVLGICRGMQMMGLWAGGSLKETGGHVGTRHVIHGEISGEVNSYHDFVLANCPPDFNVMANSEDGEIEAIHHCSLPWEAWMWHPEREETVHPRDSNRLGALFK